MHWNIIIDIVRCIHVRMYFIKDMVLHDLEPDYFMPLKYLKSSISKHGSDSK